LIQINANVLGRAMTSKRRTVAHLTTLMLLMLIACQALPATATNNATIIVIGPQPTNQPDPFLRTVLRLATVILILALLGSLLLIISSTFTIPLPYR